MDIVGAQEKALGVAFEAVLYQNFGVAKRGVARVTAVRPDGFGTESRWAKSLILNASGRGRRFLYGKAPASSVLTPERTCSLIDALLPFPLVFRLGPLSVPVRASEAGIFQLKRGAAAIQFEGSVEKLILPVVFEANCGNEC